MRTSSLMSPQALESGFQVDAPPHTALSPGCGPGAHYSRVLFVCLNMVDYSSPVFTFINRRQSCQPHLLYLGSQGRSSSFYIHMTKACSYSTECTIWCAARCLLGYLYFVQVQSLCFRCRGSHHCPAVRSNRYAWGGDKKKRKPHTM